jgi:hypothetical protein
MKVTVVNLKAPENFEGISLTPELLAGTGARYSRNNEGVEAIANKIDWDDPDGNVEKLFKLADYGHASIYDLAPVSVFIDDISILAAMWIFYVSPCASGQESSTRYIDWGEFEAYNKTRQHWSKYLDDHPELVEGEGKKADRFRRNFIFDHSRYFIPLSAKTNMMMVQSARNWVELMSYLMSHPLREFKDIGDELKKQLESTIPNTLKHARHKPCTWDILHSIERDVKKLDYDFVLHQDYGGWCHHHDLPTTKLSERNNRYDIFHDDIRMTSIRFGWYNASFGEIRDVNRHRTGNKKIIWRPNGWVKGNWENWQLDWAKKSFTACNRMLNNGQLEGLYLLGLGHTFQWEHVTTLDKFIYQMELRTGEGSHFAYRDMHYEIIDLINPQVKDLMLIE